MKFNKKLIIPIIAAIIILIIISLLPLIPYESQIKRESQDSRVSYTPQATTLHKSLFDVGKENIAVVGGILIILITIALLVWLFVNVFKFLIKNKPMINYTLILLILGFIICTISIVMFIDSNPSDAQIEDCLVMKLLGDSSLCEEIEAMKTKRNLSVGLFIIGGIFLITGFYKRRGDKT